MIVTAPASETTRISVLRGYEILDTEPATAFDDLTHLASQICQTPVALISLDPKIRFYAGAPLTSDGNALERCV